MITIKDNLKDPELVIKDIEELKANNEIISGCRVDVNDRWQGNDEAVTKEPSPMISSKVEVSFR